MVFAIPLLNTIVFHVFSNLSLLLSAITCYIYVARSREGAKSSFKLAYVLSPRRNAFFNHIIVLASCASYHIVRMVYFNVLPNLQGQPYHTVHRFANANFTAASIAIAGIIISFTGIMLGLFVNLQWQQSRIGKRIINVAQVILTGELVLVVVAHAAFAVAFHADYNRHAAWEAAVGYFVIVSCALIEIPLIFFILRLTILSPPQLRSSLFKLFLSATLGAGASFIHLAKLHRELARFGLDVLFTHRDPEYAPYQAIVESVEPMLELTLMTFVHSLVGTYCSVPFLFSASTAKWIEEHSSASIGASVNRIVNGSVRKSSLAPNTISVVGPSFAMPS